MEVILELEDRMKITVPQRNAIAWLADVVVIALGVVLIGAVIRDRIPGRSTRHGVPRGVPAGYRIGQGIEWERADRSIVLLLNPNCKYCSESASLYRRLASEVLRPGRARIIALFRQSESEGRKYIGDLGIEGVEVRRVDRFPPGYFLTPTVLVVDRTGTVVRSWVGRLNDSRYEEVLAALNNK